MYTLTDYRESAEYIRGKLGDFEPEVLVILGSGLGGLADIAQTPIYIPYEQIPHFKRSTAIGHAGRFVAGTVEGRRVLMMQGRLHIYEGHTMEEAAYPVRAARLLGIRRMIVTNAAGGVNTAFHAGQLMIIRDYLKFTLGNPLMGENIDEFGPRFPDMSYAFDKEYSELFKSICAERGEDAGEGNYFYMTGPMYESPAEIRAIRVLGGDAVGMSTVPEVIAANHAGMRILGVSLVTNMAAGVLDRPLTGEEVIEAANAASGRLCALMGEFIKRMD